jgi:hypothetical protein
MFPPGSCFDCVTYIIIQGSEVAGYLDRAVLRWSLAEVLPCP